MSTTIKTNFSSNSNGCSLAALKRHINTCLERWQHKNSLKKDDQHKNDHQHHQVTQVTSQTEKNYSQFQENSRGRFDKHYFKESSFVHQTTVYWKSLNTKFQKFITSRQPSVNNKDNPTTVNDSEGPRKYGRRVEIVAKLLSSTLIAKTKSTSTEERAKYFERKIKIVQQSAASNSTSDYYEDKMTITDLTFMELREEYPDLNTEVRSILTAHAQEGATISQIRDDYRKLTGLQFPIYDDVTEFLLTIPHVTAYCSEKGTRIFNIKPVEKTKHIHDMVLHQKQPPDPFVRPSSINFYYRERFRNPNYQPSNWRHNTSRRLSQNYANLNVDSVNTRGTEQQENLIPSCDSNLSRDGSEVLCENNNFYQDNCNYLLNRICNQQEPLPSQLIEKPMEELTKPTPIQHTNATASLALNNVNADMASYKNNINHLNNWFQLQHQQHQQNFNNLRTLETKRPPQNTYKTIMPRSSRSSSPTVKSWYTNESAYTDSDYDAHLLDFLLLGDDFFLYMARMELHCKFKKNERILQSGLCVSGQTIAASIRRIKAMSDRRRSVIINIGSVDIMQGRQLIQIEHDFRELILIMLKKGIKPILTTLAPIANYSHNNDVKSVLERFNNFIKREAQHKNLVVIDIWKCLVNEKGHVFFDCYQNEPRNVSGASEPYLFWNKIGRQRVLQLIESKLEY